MIKIIHLNADIVLNGTDITPTVRLDDVLFFNLLDSNKLLNLCESLKIGVLGIEGFRLFDNVPRPDMNFIADFSCLIHEDSFEEESIKSSRTFLQLSAECSDLLFEYILIYRDCNDKIPMSKWTVFRG